MRRIGMVAGVLALLGAARLMAACPEDEPDHPAASEEQPEQAGSSEPEEQPPPGEPSGPAEKVALETSDGETVAAALRRGGRPDAPAVVLVHGLGSDRSEWKDLVDALSEPPGLTTLALDMRGHGESSGGPEGWRDFERDDWPSIRQDVVAAVDHLQGREPSPGRIVAVGASLGSSAVVLAAAEDERIDAVALLSPGRAYRGVDAITPVTELGSRPLLAIAAKGESHSAQTASDQARIAERGTKRLCDGDAHGVFMLDEAPEMEALVEFIRKPEAGRSRRRESRAGDAR